ncbi:MAG: aminotransferase class I/II-fold pyridoxal phosphate-dependent enzyme [Chloracidobacterium sp.]|nr:aminotransferase class I/II-fold pyridoxal phosphate-dependent enzyme [Chloracidobacterium sp.]MCC6825812.1 aminotransferase class I/II-fold pyridoxal phosphate-dependent enzyme [Acidobacteriota bacterium]MCO5332967.1 aminotransferase class I/II-fold pyridoxal phosphate-dependent enzyme [Pyrinomonadaceae bacterium]
MTRRFDPSDEIQDHRVFGEFGDVNPSITDSSTYTFLSPERMEELFEHEIEGCFLYSRHWNPTNKYLADALARMEASEAAQVAASGMAAISSTIIQLCGAGDEIVCSRTVYGGTYALFKNFLPRLGINTRFVDMRSLDEVRSNINERTRIIYCESISNPLLDVSDIPALAAIAREHGLKLVVDNTFSPLILSPIRLGADVVVHSLTKFINGTSDCVAGSICASNEFIHRLTDINTGASMLFGAVLDSTRAASILKNLHSLHLRMRQHSRNAQFLAEKLTELGMRVHYPGLAAHPQHDLLTKLMNDGYGYGGMLALDVGDAAAANRLMTRMQEEKVGYLAVSLGYFKTLFSSPGHSTSSEIPAEEREQMGLSDGLVRFSIGLDNNIELAFERMKHCLSEAGII